MEDYWPYLGHSNLGAAGRLPSYPYAPAYRSGADFVQHDDTLDIGQLESYLAGVCPDDYTSQDVAILQQYQYSQQEQQLVSPPEALPLAASHQSLGSRSCDRLLALPESPPYSSYSSGSEPYSPENVANGGVHPSYGQPAGVSVLQLNYAQQAAPFPLSDGATPMASKQPGQLYATQEAKAIHPSSGRARSSAAPRRKRKAAAHGSADRAHDLPVASHLIQDMVGGDGLDDRDLGSPSKASQIFKKESGEKAGAQMDAASASAGDEADDYPFVMDITLRPIKWQQFEGSQPWAQLVDGSGMPVKIEHYHADADKGFNFSPVDDSFVCQKKNHFQVTCTLLLSSRPTFVCLPDGSLQQLEGLYYHFYGVKKEAVKQVIRVEQSQSDRSKKPFQPIRVSLVDGKSAKATMGRLHFTETTINNMRKKGKPNPDQRYFLLVASVYAHCIGGESAPRFPIVEAASEKIIVRASNPGQFESDLEIPWHKSGGIESIYHYGTVGINNDKPDEALVVNGNVKLMGCIVQPSDKRIKEKIEEVDSKEQLARLAQLRMYRFKFRPDFGAIAGLAGDDLESHTGVLAQELRTIIPDAVRDGGDVTLANGEHIENLLVVNKDRLFMESVGAVKELCKVTETLESRMHEIEKVNQKLAQLKRQASVKSSASDVAANRTGSQQKYRAKERLKLPTTHLNSSPGCTEPSSSIVLAISRGEGKRPLCTDKAIRMTVGALIVVMTICLAAIVALYLLDKPLLLGENGNARPPMSSFTTGSWLNSAAHTAGKLTRLPSGAVPSAVYPIGLAADKAGCQMSTMSLSACCSDNSSSTCVCQPCPFVPLSRLSPEQLLVAAPFLAATYSSKSGRKKRDMEGSSSAYDVFDVVNMTVEVDSNKKLVRLTRGMCINCGVTCKKGCSNYTLLLLVHASLSASTSGSLLFESALNMSVIFDGALGSNFSQGCSRCRTESSTNSATVTEHIMPVSVTMSTDLLARNVSTVQPVSLNTSYLLPSVFTLPLGNLSRQLYLFRLSCDISDNACLLALGNSKVDLYVDVFRTCYMCGDGIIRSAKENFASLHTMLSGDDR